MTYPPTLWGPLLTLALLLTAPLYTSCTAYLPDTTEAHNTSTSPPVDHDLLWHASQTWETLQSNYPPVPHDGVQQIFTRLLGTLDLTPEESAQWEVVVLRHKVPNAFALPGGKIGINTGLLQLTRSDAEVAAILAHEIAHLTQNHHIQKKQRHAAKALLKRLANSDKSAPTTLAHTEGILLHSLPELHQIEFDADTTGLLHMARAQYDPNAAITFWQRFEHYRSRFRKTASQYTTHPPGTARINNLRASLPTAIALYQHAIKPPPRPSPTKTQAKPRRKSRR